MKEIIGLAYPPSLSKAGKTLAKERWNENNN